MDISIPIIAINVKTYQEGTGKKSLELAKLMEKISEETGASLAIAVQATDISLIAKETGIPVFAQHIDAIEYGSNTGWILPESIKEAGASGTLINHSEHQMKASEIDKCISRSHKIGLATIACANNVKTGGAIAALSPDFVAVEPPELIGGDISVTTADPAIVEGTVDVVKKVNGNVKILCGAGIKNGKDVEKAIQLGTDGVLLASGVVKARNKEKVMRDLIEGLGAK